MKRKGSVTVFFSLLLVVLLLLIQVIFRSVQIAGGRVQAECGVEEGLYSVFAGYDRELFDRYHVFFLDGGYGTGALQPGYMYRTVKSHLAENCRPGLSAWGIAGKNLWEISPGSGAVTSYTLATDLEGRAFWKQAVDYMKDTAGIQGVQLLLQKNQQQEKILEAQEKGSLLEEAEQAEKTYQEAKSQPPADAEGTDTENAVAVPPDFKNPLDVIAELRKKGILGLVLPADTEISNQGFAHGTRVSKRNLSSGMGVPYTGSDPNTVTGRLLFREYMMQHLTCYTTADKKQSQGLRYQMEYTIAGKDSDMENLRAIVRRLLLVREASNMVYLLQDAASQSKIHEMALMICGMIGFPELESVVSLALEAAWAFGESLLDVRQLLLGGKVPLIKTKESWSLALENLAELKDLLSGKRVNKKSGQSYEEYLRALLYAGKIKTQVSRTMDVVEDAIRSLPGKEPFCMDHCVGYLNVVMEVQCKGQTFSIERDYGYDM